MNNKPIIYLAGNMTPDPLIYNAWTDKLSSRLTPKFRPSASNYKSGNSFIIGQDLGRLKNAHILIVNLGVDDLNHHLTGLIVEVYEAFKQNMPIYAFTSDNLLRSKQADSPWLQSFISNEFKSQQELIDYLMSDENLLV